MASPNYLELLTQYASLLGWVTLSWTSLKVSIQGVSRKEKWNSTTSLESFLLAHYRFSLLLLPKSNLSSNIVFLMIWILYRLITNKEEGHAENMLQLFYKKEIVCACVYIRFKSISVCYFNLGDPIERFYPKLVMFYSTCLVLCFGGVKDIYSPKWGVIEQDWWIDVLLRLFGCKSQCYMLKRSLGNWF